MIGRGPTHLRGVCSGAPADCSCSILAVAGGCARESSWMACSHGASVASDRLSRAELSSSSARPGQAHGPNLLGGIDLGSLSGANSVDRKGARRVTTGQILALNCSGANPPWRLGGKKMLVSGIESWKLSFLPGDSVGRSRRGSEVQLPRSLFTQICRGAQR